MKFKIKNTRKMEGTIYISGSKNACLAEMATAILTKYKVVLNNVPQISDIKMMIELLKEAGVSVKEEKGKLVLKRKKIHSTLENNYLNKIRASYYLMGSLFSVSKSFSTSYPGGCAFDKRPIDFHLEAFQKMGGKLEEKNNKLTVKIKKKIPAVIKLSYPSVGATINIILASVLTRGKTTIINPSKEPEVLDFILLLQKMKANIYIDKDKIIVQGVRKLFGTKHTVMPDRIEAGSYLFLASSMDYAHLIIRNINILHLDEVIETLRNINVLIKISKNSIILIKNEKTKGTKILADIYPSFPTDLQQIACATLFNSSSVSLVRDLVYKNRFSEVKELQKMNALFYLKDTKLLIFPSKLTGHLVEASDLRAGFSLIIAGCLASGETIIEKAEIIMRGYEDVIGKLKNCGINIMVE